MAIAADTAPSPGRLAVVILALTVFALVLFASAPIPQDAAYHHLADTRPAFGVSNGLNVLSNVPFAMVGSFGLVGVFRRRGGPGKYRGSRPLGPYVALF